ncbi:MAG: SAM-dependent methyltransferase [Pseudanabaena frigida]|uniref:SAM-dependent methyltransferase n=1 Tax=Pseudanabaena frigida TaxID=945775 RepID=A0A2W4WF13_9CYAN|nr:MAG: SAM-dependent methyltransferase [Pseudanabaena frigida]
MKPNIANLFRDNLFRFILIAVMVSSTILACDLLSKNDLSSPNKSLIESTPLPVVPIVDPKTIEPERTPDAPYLQTPNEVVLKMLEMAMVQETDIVYDLGSGDGRIAIAAAQKFDAKSIGIEIDPELIRESDKELKSAITEAPKIRDRIKFIKQDFFKTDLRDASVITLYLLPQANLRVRSEILPKLKSGTRIVSYEYDLGDLPPTRTEKLKIGNREHVIYLWILN